MGREFMTQIEAVEKVGGSLPSATKQFCTASWLAGHSGIFDTNSLQGYEAKDFVSEMHIKPAIVTTKYEITIPEVRVSFGFESGTPQGFTHLSDSDQLSQTKAVLCAVPVSQGLGCSPIKAVRELGSERRETVRSLSGAGAGYLRGAVLSTRGPGWTVRWWTGCHANGTAG